VLVTASGARTVGPLVRAPIPADGNWAGRADGTGCKRSRELQYSLRESSSVAITYCWYKCRNGSRGRRCYRCSYSGSSNLDTQRSWIAYFARSNAKRLEVHWYDNSATQNVRLPRSLQLHSEHRIKRTCDLGPCCLSNQTF
jgi:hypothetical protein